MLGFVYDQNIFASISMLWSFEFFTCPQLRREVDVCLNSDNVKYGYEYQLQYQYKYGYKYRLQYWNKYGYKYKYEPDDPVFFLPFSPIRLFTSLQLDGAELQLVIIVIVVVGLIFQQQVWKSELSSWYNLW